jgi:uncharacterized protein (DUF885 family)
MRRSLATCSAALVCGLLVLSAQDVDTSRSEMRSTIERYSADRAIQNRSAPIEYSAAHSARMKQFYTNWLASLDRTDFDSMGQDGRIDYLLFRNQLTYELRQVDTRARNVAEISSLLPFAQTIVDLEESRRRMESMDSARAAATLSRLAKQIDEARKAVEGDARANLKKTLVGRAAATADSLRNSLRSWFNYYNGYDPLFTWWAAAPYKTTDSALQNYVTFLREKILGLKPGDASDIIGDPIGRDGLMTELEREMIPYTPEELLAIADKEYAWCEAEMKKASRLMGFGDDWLKAVERVKGLHVDPGKQTDLIRDLALEAIAFVEKRDLVTIPPLARESWRMQMMTPERQLVNPFFTGGEVISVSYPTAAMSHEQKVMSMRGNNIHFARATVFHELIPGHHLQGFMTARYRPYRAAFSTPFWGEGWSLYWEMLLWDLGFPETPENKVGMLFWRMHRAARIHFSLNFHLGNMTPQESIDYLVTRVGHEVDNATAEVRRSFSGDVAPLYQAAYMLGGLQIRALHQELVGLPAVALAKAGSGKMTNRAFHDAVLKENRIPIEMVRASLSGQRLSKDFVSGWKFYGAN